jgi:hypothetical protein
MTPHSSTILQCPPVRDAARLAIIAATVATCLFGCASPPGIIFEPKATPLTWPNQPETPRIRYVGQLAGEADLKPSRSGFKRLGEALFGSSPTETFVSPMAVCTDGGDIVFVADSNARVIHMLNLTTRAYSRLGPNTPQDRLGLPVAVIFDPETKHVLVADAISSEIAVLDLTGKRVGTIGRGLLRRPCGLVLDPASRRIFVADAAAHQIVVIGPSGDEVGRIGQRGSGPGEFN